MAKAPDGSEWVGEIKRDGYRLLAAVSGPSVRLLTRSGLDWSERLPAVQSAVADLGLVSAMLDGELVALDSAGVSSFPLLQAALKAGRNATLVYYVLTCCPRMGGILWLRPEFFAPQRVVGPVQEFATEP